MNSKILFSLLLSALFVSQSWAQCGGKTVYIQLPADWGNTIVISWEGSGRTITGATKEGAWTKFTLPTGLGNDNAAKSEIIFYNKTNFLHDAAGVSYITKTATGTANNPPITGKFACSDFGAEGTYIMEDPANLGRTILSTEPPNAKTLYFLPPHTQNWITRIPYILDANGTRPMSVDTDRCGWYKAVYFNEEPPAAAIIGLGSTLNEPIGGGVINLAQKFEEIGAEVLYFAADGNSWTTVDPMIEQSERCQYSFATIIYDTDSDVNSSFFDGGEGSGIAKGIPRNTINNNAFENMDRKMVFNQAKDGWTANNFRDAFRLEGADKSKSNVLCYDMPFKKSKDAMWEFDSDKLNTDGTINDKNFGSACGFFPPELQNPTYISDECGAACSQKRKAEGAVSLNSNIDEAEFNTGVNYGAGDFKNGENPSVWDWSKRCKRGSAESWQANELFCFESHATFTKEQGQKFYFRGDDDLWVFVDGKLELDLGGTRLASPGMIDMDKITSLKDGEKYPIDIFFCDRRTTMSNVRIKTNIYFDQSEGGSAGFFLSNTNEICLQEASSTCAAIQNNTAKCGADIADRLEYYLTVNGGGAKIWLDTARNPDNCLAVGGISVCYSGILMQPGKVSIDPTAVLGLANGAYTLYAKLKDDSYSPLQLSTLTVSESGVVPLLPTVSLSQVPFSVHSAGEVFHIEIGATAAQLRGAVVEVYNLAGKQITSTPIFGNNTTLKIATQGVYIFKLRGQGISSRSVIGVSK